MRKSLYLSIVMLLLFVSPTLAYESGPRRQDRTDVTYYLDPQNDARLGIPNSGNVIQSASIQWNRASELRLIRASTYDASKPTTIEAVNYRTNRPTCEDNPTPEDVITASVCRNSVGGTLHGTKTYLNVSPSWSWNTNGQIDFTSTPRKMDLLAAILHEFGHWYRLGHNARPSSVMTFNPTVAEQQLGDDDFRGATQLYGPRTSWEVGEAIGSVNTLTLRRNVFGYFNSSTPPPELGPRTSEIGVAVKHGSRYEMIAGYANALYVYAYFQWFTYGDDASTTQHYFTIKPGMKLTWWQYNYQQSTMGLDFITTDGTTLRDSGLRDQNNVSVHPAARGVYSLRAWHYVSIDLTPLAGKTIKHWMIAYDNGNNGITGQFRAYFDQMGIKGQSRD